MKPDSSNAAAQVVDQRCPATVLPTDPIGVATRSACCPIVLACDSAYAMPLATTLASLAEHNQHHWPLRVTVLVDAQDIGLDAATRARVLHSAPAGSLRLSWATVDPSGFDTLVRPAHVSRMTYARLLLAQALPTEVERALYLDCDLLVLGDLAALCNSPLCGATLGAVPDFHIDAHLQAARCGVCRPPTCIPDVRQYFNAGVLLVDLTAWRQRGVAERAVHYLREHPDTPYADQDALNRACDQDWTALAPAWNFQPHHCTRVDRLPAERRPHIVHFITASKPWLPASTSLNAALYNRYRDSTCFRASHTEKVAAAVQTLGWRIKHRFNRWLTPAMAATKRKADPPLASRRAGASGASDAAGAAGDSGAADASGNTQGKPGTAAPGTVTGVACAPDPATPCAAAQARPIGMPLDGTRRRLILSAAARGHRALATPWPRT
ncbi:MAG: hypothetical protein RIQ60_2156 [Pseudomonadota bacterium]|jgi:lipopolysaccharide biosynthesis glycosyltransferase